MSNSNKATHHTMQPFIYEKCIVVVILYVYVLTTTKTRLGNLNQKNCLTEDLLIIKNGGFS